MQSNASTKRKVVAILQGRTGSTRLPGKIFKPILSKPLLEVLLERILPARTVDPLVVATTEKPEDDGIAELAQRMGAEVFRGSENDCLDRYYQAAKAFNADVIVRLTGDNPLMEAGFIDMAVTEFLAHPGIDYLHPAGYPLGLSLEVFPLSTLERLWREDKSAASREHVTTVIEQNPERFKIHTMASQHDYSQMRWTVDEPSDLRFVQTVFEHFKRVRFSWEAAAAAVGEHPEWMAINRNVVQRKN